MKMKKIISLLTAVAMSSTMFATLASAALPSEKAIIHVNVVKVSESDTYSNVKAIDGYTPYIVEYSLSGTGMDLENIGMGAISIQYLVTNREAIHDTTFTLPVTTGKPANKAMNGLYTNSDYSAISSVGHASTIGERNDATLGDLATIGWVTSGVLDPYTWADGDEPPAQTTPIAANIVYVANDAEASFTYKVDESGAQDMVWSNILMVHYDTYEQLGFYSGVDGTLEFDNTTATFTGDNYSADVAVESVTLDKESIELDINGKTSEQLTATVLPADATDKTVTWTSSSDKITVVDGIVSLNGAAKGDTATITATAGSYSDTCTVTVVDTTPIAVGSVNIEQDSIVLDVYNSTSAQLNVTVLPENAADKTVTWSSDNAKITVSNTGLVELAGAAKGDTATITATAGGKSDTCTVTVQDSTPVIPDEFDGVITHDDYAGVPAGKMIVTHRTAVTGVSADTRVSVSYNGEEARVFGTTLGEYLQLGAGLTFEGKIRFAVLCDDDLDANAFAFNIQ